MIDADLLKGLPPAEAERVLALGQRMLLTSGAELFHLGDAADSLYLVSRGRIRLTLPMQVRGREEDVLVEERSSGQTVGWSALIPPYRFTLTAAAQLETEVIALRRDALECLLRRPSGYRLRRLAESRQRHRPAPAAFQAMWLREIQRMVELRCA